MAVHSHSVVLGFFFILIFIKKRATSFRRMFCFRGISCSHSRILILIPPIWICRTILINSLSISKAFLLQSTIGFKEERAHLAKTTFSYFPRLLSQKKRLTGYNELKKPLHKCIYIRQQGKKCTDISLTEAITVLTHCLPE